jgi:hypothetical protein
MSTWPGTRVATVAGRPIPLAWVEARLASLLRGRLGRHLPPGESDEMRRLRRWIVQELVTRMLLLHEAEQARLWSWPDGGKGQDRHGASAPSLPDEVVDRLVERVTGHVVVTRSQIDAVLERESQSHEQPEARRIRFVIADRASRAWSWMDGLDAGPTEDRELVRSGQMWLHRGEWVGPLEDAIFEADIGAVVGPFDLEQGWTAARLDAVRPASVPSIREARARVGAELLRYGRARAFEGWIAARRAALAEIELEYEHPGHPVHGIVQHRH